MTNHGGGAYGWMTYTSFDMGTGSGGWQVKDRVDLADAEVAELRSRINTQVSMELPRFPSPEDIAAFPRRLLYAPCGPGTAWWHAVPAGPDASGRPGNVFAHVVLDRWTTTSAVHPIDLWRSPDWLTPYGADAVNQATLQPQTEPHPGRSIDAASVIAFLLDLSTYRLGTLGALLDACAAATAGGAKVVLISDTVDSVALWFGAVSWLMTTEQARRTFFFSTLERANSLEETFRTGVVVAAVPRADRAEVDQMDGVVVIDDAELISMGDLGGHPHRTENGTEIVATEWSAMAQVALMDQVSAELVLARLAAMGGDLSGAADPAWGLAIVVSQQRELLADAEQEAASVIMRSSPALFSEDSPGFAEAAALVGDHLGTTAAQAWTRLSGRQPGADSGGAVTQMILGGYVIRALADVDWLTAERTGSVPLPDQVDLVDQAAAEAVRTALQTLERLRVDEDLGPDRRAQALGAVADVVARLGLQDEQLHETIRLGLEGVFVFHLFEPSGADLVSRLGPFAEVTQETYLRPLVSNELAARVGQPLGRRISPAVVSWLFPESPAPVRISASLDIDACRLRAEHAAHLFAQDRDAHAGERPLVVWASLADHDGPQPVLGRYFAAPPWSPGDVLTLWNAFPGAISADWLGPTLKGSFPGSDLDLLCHELLASAWTTEHLYDSTRGPVENLAWLRALESQKWWHWTSTSGPPQIMRILESAQAGQQWPDLSFTGATLRTLAVAGVLGGLLGTRARVLGSVREAVVDAQIEFDATQMGQLEEGADRLDFNLGRACFAAMVAEDDFPEPSLARDHDRWMRKCVVADGSTKNPVLNRLLRHVTEKNGESFDGVRRDTIEQAQFRIPYDYESRERVRRSIEKFAVLWLKSHLANPPESVRRKAQHS